MIPILVVWCFFFFDLVRLFMKSLRVMAQGSIKLLFSAFPVIYQNINMFLFTFSDKKGNVLEFIFTDIYSNSKME